MSLRRRAGSPTGAEDAGLKEDGAEEAGANETGNDEMGGEAAGANKAGAAEAGDDEAGNDEAVADVGASVPDVASVTMRHWKAKSRQSATVRPSPVAERRAPNGRRRVRAKRL